MDAPPFLFVGGCKQVMKQRNYLKISIAASKRKLFYNIIRIFQHCWSKCKRIPHLKSRPPNTSSVNQVWLTNRNSHLRSRMKELFFLCGCLFPKHLKYFRRPGWGYFTSPIRSFLENLSQSYTFDFHWRYIFILESGIIDS